MAIETMFHRRLVYAGISEDGVECELIHSFWTPFDSLQRVLQLFRLIAAFEQPTTSGKRDGIGNGSCTRLILSRLDLASTVRSVTVSRRARKETWSKGCCSWKRPTDMQ